MLIIVAETKKTEIHSSRYPLLPQPHPQTDRWTQHLEVPAPTPRFNEPSHPEQPLWPQQREARRSLQPLPMAHLRHRKSTWNQGNFPVTEGSHSIYMCVSERSILAQMTHLVCSKKLVALAHRDAAKFRTECKTADGSTDFSSAQLWMKLLCGFTGFQSNRM